MTLAERLAWVLGNRDISYQRLARHARTPPGDLDPHRPWWPEATAQRLRELAAGAEPIPHERHVLDYYVGMSEERFIPSSTSSDAGGTSRASG